MSLFVRKPIFAGLLSFVLLLVICLSVSVPLMNATCIYDEGLVHISSEAKVSLQHVLGWNLHDLAVNGLTPKQVTLTGQGWLMLILFHLGIPSLLTLRFFFAKRRSELPDEE
jgi:hypothetical protein